MLIKHPKQDAVISTHTLTWSVTPLLGAESETKNHFNSHAHVERDMIDLIINRKFRHFNSHAHVERDILISFS